MTAEEKDAAIERIADIAADPPLPYDARCALWSLVDELLAYAEVRLARTDEQRPLSRMERHYTLAAQSNAWRYLTGYLMEYSIDPTYLWIEAFEAVLAEGPC